MNLDIWELPSGEITFEVLVRATDFTEGSMVVELQGSTKTVNLGLLNGSSVIGAAQATGKECGTGAMEQTGPGSIKT